MKKFKNSKAITLIALVITIIVLLILAGVTISTLSGENGLLNRAKSARETSQNSQIEENVTLADYENKVGEYVDSTRNQVTIGKEEYDKLLKKGTWELLATTSSTTFTNFSVPDLSKFSSLVLTADSSASSALIGSTIMSYEIFKTHNTSSCTAYFVATSGGALFSVSAYYENDTSIYMRCDNTVAKNARLYGIY